MTALYTFDVFSTLDGYGSYGPQGDWGGYWGKDGPEFLDRRLALYRAPQRLVLGANTIRMRSLPAVPTCSEVTRAEILQGLRSSERDRAEALFVVLHWTDVDEKIARRAGELGRRYRRSHPGLALADLLIAATALELDQPLATANTRHFPMFARLRPPY